MKTTTGNPESRSPSANLDFLRSTCRLWRPIGALVLAAGLFLPIDSPSLLTGPPRRAGRVGEGVAAHASTLLVVKR